jgi:CxxC-x17-CxxC domain-containing protein
MSNFSDQTMTCRDCGQPFTWTAGEQEFYQQKGFANPPSRCPNCRQAKKANFNASRQMYPATCAKCGKTCQVPFQPRGDKPVYCSDCFRQMKGA